MCIGWIQGLTETFLMSSIIPLASKFQCTQNQLKNWISWKWVLSLRQCLDLLPWGQFCGWECIGRADPSFSSSFLKRTSNKASFKALFKLQERFEVYLEGMLPDGILPPSWSTCVPKLYNIVPTHYPRVRYP